MDTSTHVDTPVFLAATFRYSDDPPAMRRFLELLGLDTLVSRDDGWYEMRGRTGGVCLHASGDRSDTASPGGRTELTLLTPDVGSATTYLESQGIGGPIWDEAYGKQASIDPPLGQAIMIHEEMSDFYGYRRHEPQPGPVDVVTVYFTDDFVAARQFFGQLGFEPRDRGVEGWQVLFHTDTRSLIGLHHTDDRRSAGDAAMSFETSENLDVLAARLRSHGHTPTFRDDPPRIEVVDPDGQMVEIHHSPSPGHR